VHKICSTVDGLAINSIDENQGMAAILAWQWANCQTAPKLPLANQLGKAAAL